MGVHPFTGGFDAVVSRNGVMLFSDPVATFTDLGRVSRSMRFGEDVEDAFGYLSRQLGWLLEWLDNGSRAGALAELRRSVESHVTSDAVSYDSAMWLVEGRR